MLLSNLPPKECKIKTFVYIKDTNQIIIVLTDGQIDRNTEILFFGF